MIDYLTSGRRRGLVSLSVLVIGGSLGCAHSGGAGPRDGEVVEVKREHSSQELSECSRGAEGADRLGPGARATVETNGGIVEERGVCMLRDAPIGRAIDLRMSISFTEAPDSVTAIFVEAVEPADLGERIRREIEPLIVGCVSPSYDEPSDIETEASASTLRVSEGESFTIEANLNAPCSIAGISRVGGDLCLEISKDYDGEMKVSLFTRDLILDEHLLGDVAITVRPSDEEGALLVDVHLSMDRLPRDWARSFEQTLERSLAPLAAHLEAATVVFKGLFDLVLGILAHVVVDTMRSQGYEVR